MGLPNYRRSLSAGPHTPLAVLVYPSARHITAVTSVTGSKSWAVPHRCPLDAESPFASLRCYLAEGNICCHLNRHYPVFIAHTGSWARPKSSPRLRLSLLRWVFAGCCQSLLDDGPSRRYLHNLCKGAWTLTPPRSYDPVRLDVLALGLDASIESTSASPQSRRARHAKEIPCNATSTERGISGLQSFANVQAPLLARPPGCTYRCDSHRAAGPFTSRNEHAVTQHEP